MSSVFSPKEGKALGWGKIRRRGLEVWPKPFPLAPAGRVEMRGVEPRSKHGTNLLSTCLSSLWVFVCGARLRLPCPTP